jgi:hypothetical protein
MPNMSCAMRLCGVEARLLRIIEKMPREFTYVNSMIKALKF